MKPFVVVLALVPALTASAIAQQITNQGVSIGRNVGDGLVVAKRQADIDVLRSLTLERARKTADVSTGDANGLAAAYATKIEQARAYGSLAQLLDRNMPELASRGFVGIRWMFDRVEPDRIHTTQEAWNGQGYDYDEWITQGTREFDFLGTWLERTPGRPIRIDLGKKLGIRKYALVLKDGRRVSAGRYDYAGKPFVLLAFQTPLSGDVAAFFEESGATGPLRLELWFDAGEGLLAKARAVPAGAASGKVAREFEQIFVGYADEIRVEPPGSSSSSLDRTSVPDQTATPAAAPAPVRVGGNIPVPQQTKRVQPVYPPAAQSARVQGLVLIEATISVTGKVTDTKVLRSIPLLDQGAVDAVKQWEFAPTTINGQPVPVIMPITVTFTLDSPASSAAGAAVLPRPPQGATIVPLSSMRAQDGAMTYWEITQQRLDRLPVWNPRDSPPPLSLLDAFKAGETFLKQQNPEVKAFEIGSVNLSRGYGAFAQRDRWYYNISFDPVVGGRRLAGNAGFLVVVLMDGSVVEPRVEAAR